MPALLRARPATRRVPAQHEAAVEPRPPRGTRPGVSRWMSAAQTQESARALCRWPTRVCVVKIGSPVGVVGLRNGDLVAYWLLKTEAEAWSWEMQVERGAKGEVWSGVRNPRARNNLLEMKLRDRAFFYHTGSEKRIVGIVEVTREAYPDPTDHTNTWAAVTVKALVPL